MQAAQLPPDALEVAQKWAGEVAAGRESMGNLMRRVNRAAANDPLLLRRAAAALQRVLDAQPAT